MHDVRGGKVVAKLQLSVPESIAEEVRRRARAEGLSVSAYLAGIVRREVVGGWPDGYFERVVGAWEGPLERPPRGNIEERDPLP